MDGIYGLMKQVVYFLLLVGIVRNLTGREYEKYTHLTIGLCLVLMLASPLMEFLTGGDFESIWQKNELEQEFFWELQTIGGPDAAAVSSSAWEDGVIREYEEIIRRQSQELLAELGVTVVSVELWLETMDSSQTRVVNGFTIQVELKQEDAANNGLQEDSGTGGTASGSTKENGTDRTESSVTGQQDGGTMRPVQEIQGIGEISITDIILGLDKEKGSIPDGSVYAMAIKKRLADFYNMDGAHINVIIQ